VNSNEGRGRVDSAGTGDLGDRCLRAALTLFGRLLFYVQGRSRVSRVRKPVMYAYCVCDHSEDKHDVILNCKVPMCSCDRFVLGTYSTVYDATPVGIPIISLGPMQEELDEVEAVADADAWVRSLPNKR